MCTMNDLIRKLFRRTSRATRGRFVGRMRTRDDAFKFRMGAGFLGDVNRTHPASIEPALQSNTPATAFGQPVVIAADTTNGVRPLAPGDNGLTAIFGITVRPYPLQAATAPNDFGGTQSAGGAITQGGTPPAKGAIDILKSGYIIGKLSGGTQPAKGGAVFIWVAASSGNHVQGGFEAAATGGSTMALDAKSYFNGPSDANGNVEVAFNL
jgi:hypothetical protein